MRRFAAIAVVSCVLLPVACSKPEPPRPKVVNPLIDSLDQFTPVLSETIRRPLTGLEVFEQWLKGEDRTDSLPAPSARPESSPRPVAGKFARAETLLPSRGKPVVPAGDKTMSITGTIKRISLEGGFWGLVGDDGHNYDPSGLPPPVLKDGARVKLNVRVRRDGASIRMWGTPVEVLSCELLR